MTRIAKLPALPGLLGEIEQIAGLQAALQVASAAGGRRRYVPAPKRLDADHWLVKAVGREKAGLIAKHLVGENSGLPITFPLGPAGSRAARWHAIHQALQSGETADSIAATHGIHERTVRRHRTGVSGMPSDADNRQTKLFD
ncbi:helix-turn-helix domain-containing protein [Ferrovibrio sp.]|uniref:helix-turn-helix domain-containing protein n=1 Tax=Ferrovibrio sp. TaxID=1917215 RepID=UPI0035AFA90D